MRANEEIRLAAKDANVCLWQIADALGIADHTFSRKLRKELNEEKKKEILDIINRIKKPS